jgi:hypothetical protein
LQIKNFVNNAKYGIVSWTRAQLSKAGCSKNGEVGYFFMELSRIGPCGLLVFHGDYLDAAKEEGDLEE